MSHQLSFRVLYEYDSRVKGITVPIGLNYRDNEVRLLAKIDTGADNCIFQREYGEMIGLTIEDGQHQKFETGTGTFQAYGHTVNLEVLSFRIESLVFFAENPTFPRNVLGRHGWLQNMRIGLVDYDSRLYLSAYNGP